MPKDRPDHRLYDQRIVERFVQRGNVTEAELEKHTKSLPDLADKAVPLGTDTEYDESDEE